MITKTKVKQNGRIFEYRALAGAEYSIPKKVYVPKEVPKGVKYIKIVGNVTTVSPNSYHTKGSSPKRSVWIGSSSDM